VLLLLLLLLLQGNAIGSGKRLTSTVNSCGICNGELKDNSHLGEQVRARTGFQHTVLGERDPTAYLVRNYQFPASPGGLVFGGRGS
jgi:hypothetical protein